MIPLDPRTQRRMLDSIPEPSKLTCLGLNIMDEDNWLCANLERFRNHNLKSMQLKFSGKEFPTHLLEMLYEFELEHLKISLPIYKQDCMMFLGEILTTNPGLKSLEVKIQGQLGRVLRGSLKALFQEGIGELSQLETLKVNLDFPNLGMKGVALKCLSETVKKLPNLKELSYIQGYRDFEDGFKYLASTLKTHCEKLKTLEIGTQSNSKYSHSGNIEDEDMAIFYEALRNMVGLEKLAFKKFSFFDGVLENLLIEIGQLKRLREVYLDLKPRIKRKRLTKCIQKIIEKGIIQDFVLAGEMNFDYDPTDTEKEQIIEYKDLVCKKSRLRRFQIEGGGYSLDKFTFMNYVK